MKVLVTGGAGFIGSHICDLLLKKDFNVFVIDNLSTGSIKNLSKGVTFYETDINSNETKKIIKKERPDFIIHTAAQTNVGNSMKDPVNDAYINVLGTISLLELAKQCKVKKFIFASSCAVYGETENISISEKHPTLPNSFYAQSKYVGEHYIKLYRRLYGLPYTILRFANVYGPRQTSTGEGGVISIFANLFLKNEQPTIFGSGAQTRDFVFVKDVAAANIAALELGANETFNVGTNHSISITELHALFNEATNLKLLPLYKPSRDGDILFSRLNNNKAKKLLNWTPNTPLNKGISETLEYYHTNC